MSRETVVQMISIFDKAFTKPLDEDIAALWVMTLKAHDAAVLKAATNHCLTRCKFYPRLAEVTQAVDLIYEKRRAGQRWDEVERREELRALPPRTVGPVVPLQVIFGLRDRGKMPDRNDLKRLEEHRAELFELLHDETPMRALDRAEEILTA